MNDKGINMRKRIAMGDTVKGYARGGSVGMPEGKAVPQHHKLAVTGQALAKGGTVGSALPSISVRSSGSAVNPLRASKAANGIPGFKKGGQCR